MVTLNPNWLSKLALVLRADPRRSAASKKGEPKRIRINGRYAKKTEPRRKSGLDLDSFKESLIEIKGAPLVGTLGFMSPEGDFYAMSRSTSHEDYLIDFLDEKTLNKLEGQFQDYDYSMLHELLFSGGWGRFRVNGSSRGEDSELNIQFGKPTVEQLKSIKLALDVYDSVNYDSDSGSAIGKGRTKNLLFGTL